MLAASFSQYGSLATRVPPVILLDARRKHLPSRLIKAWLTLPVLHTRFHRELGVAEGASACIPYMNAQSDQMTFVFHTFGLILTGND